ncbi:hypothetical protein LNQ49_05965 [Flavobacterium sp. F-65]|uniref:Knr4/Smi1-like domain-containing protein n=1 Tax=Flavobacterium pisciphilum TaxID=2893755 RepID=A0ABS8MQU9_9FLAO|nr:hypothetical protein [Flavobacterium sp. F-65]MCC9071137.1 hypothetical protein [Flavobacterium sp. F-65]
MRVIDLKFKIEKKFEKIKLRSDVYGLQIQCNTKFKKGISNKEIDELEVLFGFVFPWNYREMLLILGDLDVSQISINPDDEMDIEYSKDSFFYQYPEDFEKSRWLIDEINEFKSEVELVLDEAGFDISKIVGYIPLHSHRALVVFKDKYLSPVVSVWQADVIMFGDNLNEYLMNEF